MRARQTLHLSEQKTQVFRVQADMALRNTALVWLGVAAHQARVQQGFVDDDVPVVAQIGHLHTDAIGCRRDLGRVL